MWFLRSKREILYCQSKYDDGMRQVVCCGDPKRGAAERIPGESGSSTQTVPNLLLIKVIASFYGSTMWLFVTNFTQRQPAATHQLVEVDTFFPCGLWWPQDHYVLGLCD